MDENAVRSLLERAAGSDAPPTTVDVVRARRIGRRRRRLRLVGPPATSAVVVGAVAVLAATGVVPTVSGPAPQMFGRVRPVKLSVAEIGMLTSSARTETVATELTNALQRLVYRCMRAKHLPYRPAHEVAGSAASWALYHPELPPYTSLADREAHGYGFYDDAIRTSHRRSADRTGRHVRSPHYSRRYLNELWGSGRDRVTVTSPIGPSFSTPGGGCYGHAERLLYGSVVNYGLATEDASSGFTNLLATAVEADPAFAAVIGRWSACMARHGLIYHAPFDAWNSLAERIDKHATPGLHRLEIRVAVADYRCAQAVRLLPHLLAIQAWLASRLNPQLEDYLDRLVTIENAALAAAHRLLR